ncbi:MAG TPA: penicillin-binding protein 2 [Oscillatoriaceae cyanobacterium M33_DOE_052]|uniref:Penicillin-binding protein 2 n=1 Tax=Planktothricoides sp. SpSt-374 TaxID=2282167 RepID=A0A7C3ZLF9_9CYAN|nr:penicillin-binding protein 2 [Oscillatoriaceae cyanobacterium M33_DOE_052]
MDALKVGREYSFLSGASVAKQAGFERTKKSIVLMVLITVAMSTYIGRLAQLQLVEGSHYRERADDNRTRLVPIPSDRGAILDRKGKILAGSKLSRSVFLWPREQTPEGWQLMAHKLAPILKLTPEEILGKLEQSGYDSKMSVRIAQNINIEAFVRLSERASEFRGLEIRGESTRYYPQGNLGGHLLGYIGEASEAELKANPDYPMGIIVGKMGVEKMADRIINGKWGSRLVEVNSHGDEVRDLDKTDAKSGEDVLLTVDLDLQKTAEKALANRRGAVVVLDVKTGGVLAIASGPTFDPNLFTRKIKKSDWEQLQSPDNPLLNRALQGYPPGSTFKIITSAAAMGSGKYSPYSILGTSSSITVGGISFYEHSGGYGAIGFRDALAYSSNTFFYQVGLDIGPQEIAKWANKLGIGKTTDLDLLGLEGGTNGSVPTPEEKQQIYGEPWYVGDSVTTAIGQGLVLVTPLEMAVMTASIANGGYRVKPHLLASQTNTPATKPEPTGMAPETVATIKDGLVAVVQKGTARTLNDGSIPLVAGKTGTSEVFGQTSHSLFVSYGPANNPQIAIAAIVENGGYGSVSAAPIAHEIYKTYFGQQKTAKPKP